jgi:hypothetical protein
MVIDAPNGDGRPWDRRILEKDMFGVYGVLRTWALRYCILAWFMGVK